LTLDHLSKGGSSLLLLVFSPFSSDDICHGKRRSIEKL
jgi:hypothetical protein